MTDADFTLPAEPGMESVHVVELVEPGSGMNPSYPPYRVYRITGSGEWVETEAKGFTTLGGQELPPEPTGWRRWWPWAAGAAGVVLAGGWAWRAWHRRAAVPVEVRWFGRPTETKEGRP